MCFGSEESAAYKLERVKVKRLQEFFGSSSAGRPSLFIPLAANGYKTENFVLAKSFRIMY